MSKRWPDKLIVGLTGNIATGKSAVMRLAAERGALALDADKLVHEILDQDVAVQAAVTGAFGADVRKPDGRIDRAALGAIVFQSPEALRRLERITHPAVRERLAERIGAAAETVVFVEAIKLIESGLARDCDQIWVTRCPEATQVRRLVVCRGLDRATAAARVQLQSSQEEKVARADIVIDTNGTMAQTEALFDLAWRRLDIPRPVKPHRAARRATAAPAVGGGPQRLTPETAGAAKSRLASKAPQEAPSPAPAAGPAVAEGVFVRRARPADVPSIMLLMKRASAGSGPLRRADVLEALSERGYLIGQEATTISTVAGWNSESGIARIEQFFVVPAEAAAVTGSAVLEEIVQTAADLICEVIFAYLDPAQPDEVRQLFGDRGFEPARRAELPAPWQEAIAADAPAGSEVWLRILRGTRLAAARRNS